MGVHLKLLSDPRNAVEAQTVSGLLEKVIFTQLPAMLGGQLQNRARAAIGPEQLQRFDDRLADAIASAFHRDRAEVYRRIQAGQLSFDATSLAPSGADGTSVLGRLLKIDREQAERASEIAGRSRVRRRESTRRSVRNPDPEPPPVRPIQWGATKYSRRAYRRICDIPLDIPKDELERRLSVFGGNHFGMCPTINLHGIEFRAVLPQS